MGALGIGTVIGERYRLKREIARGGMGVVFEAEHLPDGRAVAVKLLTGEQAHLGEARQRLMREGEALLAGQHPGVVTALATGVAEHGPFLVMELLEGRPLDGILTVRRKIPVADTVFIGVQLCAALAVVHERGLLHRDIKPGNVFIARDEHGDEVAKLFDFGIAKVTRGAPKLTQMGAVLGTPEYMAPEQLLAQEDIDHRCDIYALGVTLYECLTGSVPFEGQFGEVLLKSATQPIPPLRHRCPEAPIELARVVEKALAREASARFASARELGDALRFASPFPMRASTLLGRKIDAGTRPTASRLPPPLPLSRAEVSFAGARTLQPPQPSRLPPPLPNHVVSATAPVIQEADLQAPRRRFARAVYVTYVGVIQRDRTVIDARSEDISVGGMLILPKTACQEEDISAVSFALPMTGKIVEVPAVARWVKTARVKQAMGIQFAAVPDEVFTAIERYVQVMGAEEA